jgi:Transposase DDE domain
MIDSTPVSATTEVILRKISGIGKCQLKFFIHIVRLVLSLRGRLNYLTMARYGSYSEKSYRLNFGKMGQSYDFKSFNSQLIKTYCSSTLAWVFDPTYINKSGKHTPGTGYFWSGCAGALKWGLELSELAVLDVVNHTAMHYHAVRTSFVKGEESLRAYYAQLLCEQAEELLKISKIMIFDAFFSKKAFVDSICKSGFILVSRLQKNIYLRYAYKGEQKKGKGRNKVYGDKIDLKNLSPDHFTLFEQNQEERAYEGLAHVRGLKRWCKVVIVHKIKEGKVKSALIYFSTDITMSGQQVYDYYRLRYQIEFIFRDTKGYLGLQHTQSRQEEALDFHFNLALTTYNIAKATHWLALDKEQRNAFSIQDIKTQYVNQLLLDRLISIYGKDPSVEINNPEIRKLYHLGRIAA